MSWLPIAGAAAGALLGGLGGSNEHTRTTTTDLPDWLKSYIRGNVDAATPLRDSLASRPNPLIGASEDELFRVLTGAYLTPDSNPFLNDYAGAVADRVGASIDSRFSAAGRYGSGAHQETLARGIGESILPLYSGAYDSERARMHSAAMGAPGVVQGSVQAQFQPFTSYADLLPKLSGGVSNEPFYTNKAGSMLSGALAGASLGRMFGTPAKA